MTQVNEKNYSAPEMMVLDVEMEAAILQTSGNPSLSNFSALGDEEDFD